MKILIVGGGISGLALAAFLKDSTVEYDIVERCPDWSHQGYLIALWDNGRDILNKLRLAEKLDAAGTRVRSNSLRDGSGREIRTVGLSSFYSEFGGAVTIIGRKDVHSWVLEKVDPSKIAMKRTVTRIDKDGPRSSVLFDDGSTVTYDVVVGADGVHSKVRSLVFGNDIESFTNWRAWYIWIDNAFDVPASIVEYVEPGENITVFAAEGKTLATMFAPADHHAWDTQEGRIDRLKVLFKDETHIVPAALEKLKDDDAMPTDLADVQLGHTVKGNVALVGDAAHCFGPMAGLGTSMALEDSYTLAAELLKVSGPFTLEDALSAYEIRRKKRRNIARRLNHRIRSGALIKSRLWTRMIMKIAALIPDSIFTSDYRKLLREEI